ncbi:MAG: sulfate adenylyltransferase subunit 2 [Alphaproteobacteria bacterium]|nr:sulfate adenylyltransferase subunit 2 [Alphaproteobacteria bacterium]
MDRPEVDPLSHLDWLESEAIHILREIAGECEKPALLFSGGKDSAVVLRLAEKAFRPAALPFPLLHVDTGHNFPEVIAYRDRRVAETGERLIVAAVEDSIARGTVVVRSVTDSRNAAQAVTFGQWDPKAQRPELWSLYNTELNRGEHLRAFPISNWTEADVWAYIARENIPLPEIYFTHPREVVRRGGLLAPVTDLTPARPGDRVERLNVRFRTVGDVTCTCPVESTAATPLEILAETQRATLSERGATRMDDQTSEASMERRKREGYF